LFCHCDFSFEAMSLRGLGYQGHGHTNDKGVHGLPAVNPRDLSRL
jgi:hypothetical protein